MGYRGDDLDLRTPESWRPSESWGPPSAGPTEAASAGRPGDRTVAGRAPTGPIWVDKTVLAACNHAYDVALAHRSAEVRLEHLLYALTRNDDAAEILEARGIHLTALSRELGAIIAGELPAGLPNGGATPRRAPDLEETLRRAATAATRRDAPANADDVLDAITGMHTNSPVIAELASAMTHETVKTPAMVSARREPGKDAQRAEVAATPNDNSQNTRLDALEQMVRALTDDLRNERTVFKGVLQELQRETMAHRDDIPRPRSRFMQRDPRDRYPGYERPLQSTHAASAGDIAPVLDRLAALERTILAIREEAFDLAPVMSRLDLIEEAVLSNDLNPTHALGEQVKALEAHIKAQASPADLTEMIKRLEETVERQRSELAVAVLTPLVQRFETIIGAIDEHKAATNTALSAISERMTALETSAHESAAKIEEKEATHAEELSEVHEAITKLNANQHTFASSVDTWRGENTDKLDIVEAGIFGLDTRLADVERESAKSTQMLHGLTGMLERIHAATAERYDRRNRFWYWLFGTNDWMAASWPAEAAHNADAENDTEEKPESDEPEADTLQPELQSEKTKPDQPQPDQS